MRLRDSISVKLTISNVTPDLMALIPDCRASDPMCTKGGLSSQRWAATIESHCKTTLGELCDANRPTSGMALVRGTAQT